MKLPPQEQIDIAVMWLQSNEGDGGEVDACKAVAEWLDAYANDLLLRKAARKGGVTVTALRRRLAQSSGMLPTREEAEESKLRN